MDQVDRLGGLVCREGCGLARWFLGAPVWLLPSPSSAPAKLAACGGSCQSTATFLAPRIQLRAGEAPPGFLDLFIFQGMLLAPAWQWQRSAGHLCSAEAA